MLYRKFAIAVLVIAPIVVMGIQGFTPAHHQEDQTSDPDTPHTSPMPVTVPVVAPMPPSIPAPPVQSGEMQSDGGQSDIGDAGQPLPGAGQPMLAPGNGLPAAAPTNGGPGIPVAQATAPLPATQQ